MKSQIILVRYGQYEDGHLSSEGRETMLASAQKIKPHMQGKILLVAANVPRALQSAKVIGEVLGIQEVESFPEFYAAPEDNVPIDVSAAKACIFSLMKNCDTLVAVISREYIEELPSVVVNTAEESTPVKLDRGEALVIDFDLKSLTYVRN